MRVRIEHEVVFIHHEDVPHYKKSGSVVRNTFFWALRSIAAQSSFDRDWEYEAEVWLALQRMLLTFSESGYLGLRETTLEFSADAEIPPILKPVSTWLDSD